MNYFEEKAEQVIPDKLNVFGIEIWSRYGKAYELIEMMNFAEKCALSKLNHHVKAIFYDTKANMCSFELVNELSALEDELLKSIALETIGQFTWNQSVLHGKPLSEYNIEDDSDFWSDNYEDGIKTNYSDITTIMTTKVQTAHEHFKCHQDWCDIIKKEATNNSNYAIAGYRTFYMLKYFPAYLAEHYDLIDEICNNFGDITNQTILSLGCGCGVDYYALRCKLGHQNFQYHGYDINDWSIYQPSEPNAIFNNNKGIQDVTQREIDETDIFIFAKSIGNIGEHIDEFAKKLLNHKKDEFIIGYTFIRNQDIRVIGGLQESKIIDKLLSGKFLLDKKSTKIGEYLYWDDGKALISKYPFFKYPDDIQTFLKNFRSQCSPSKIKDECAICDHGFSPILNNKYLAISYKKYMRKNDHKRK